jgi:hypothetical protein
VSLQRTVHAAAVAVILVTLESALAKSSVFSFDYDGAHYLLNTKQRACSGDVTA